MAEEMATRRDYDDLVATRPYKFTPEEVGYEEAPEGSAIRCAACLHYFRRAIDGLATCEIMRSDETDSEGVRPDWRCLWQNVDGDVFPLQEEG
jgi:hypothetical protein